MHVILHRTATVMIAQTGAYSEKAALEIGERPSRIGRIPLDLERESKRVSIGPQRFVQGKD